eukprot:COSAG01_NODE_227_length_21107_cov_85.615099_12_plen_200_part_00
MLGECPQLVQSNAHWVRHCVPFKSSGASSPSSVPRQQPHPRWMELIDYQSEIGYYSLIDCSLCRGEPESRLSSLRTPCVGRDEGVGTVARQPLYRVRFRQGDLWGTTEAPVVQDSVDVEIYQHWLEPAPVSAAAAATLAGSRANGSVPAEEHRPAGPAAPTRHHRVRRSVCIHPTLILTGLSEPVELSVELSVEPGHIG